MSDEPSKYIWPSKYRDGPPNIYGPPDIYGPPNIEPSKRMGVKKKTQRTNTEDRVTSTHALYAPDKKVVVREYRKGKSGR